MARRLIILAAVTVAVLALASGAASQAPVPAPSMDCTAAVTGLSSCLPYVQKGSTQGKPTGVCCTGVKAATKSPATVSCLCAAFTQYGAQVDLARAAGLPAACGEDPNAFAACNIKVPGAPAPAPTAPGTAPAAPAVPSPGSSKSAAAIRSPVSAFAVVVAVAATLLSHCLL